MMSPHKQHNKQYHSSSIRYNHSDANSITNNSLTNNSLTNNSLTNNSITNNSRGSSEMETVFLRDDFSDGSSLSSNLTQTQLPHGIQENINLIDGGRVGSGGTRRGRKHHHHHHHHHHQDGDGDGDISGLFHLLFQVLSDKFSHLCRRCGRRKCRCCGTKQRLRDCIRRCSNGIVTQSFAKIQINDGRYSTTTTSPSKSTFCVLVFILCMVLTLNYRTSLRRYTTTNNNNYGSPYFFQQQSSWNRHNNHDAEYQSYGLFRNIDNNAWSRMKQRVQNTKPHLYANPTTFIDEPNVWYHNNWNQDFTCPFAQRVGGAYSPTEMTTTVGNNNNNNNNNDSGNRMKQKREEVASVMDGGWLGDGPKWVCNPRSIVQMVQQRQQRISLNDNNNHNNNDPTTKRNGGGFLHNLLLRGKQHRHSDTQPSERLPNNGCLIYSIGVNGNELEFERSIQHILTAEATALANAAAFDADRGGGGGGTNTKESTLPTPFCEIHVFDPDGRHKKLFVDDGIKYHDWGIVHQSQNRDDGDYDINGFGFGGGSIGGSGGSSGARGNTGANFKTFQETVKELGHVGHVVDIMKVDCKLCEWDIYQDWFDRGGGPAAKGGSGVSKRNRDPNKQEVEEGLYMIHQLLVEVHGTPEKSVNGFFDKMREENYVIFHKEPNTQEFGGTCQDYAFLKLRPEFFES